MLSHILKHFHYFLLTLEIKVLYYALSKLIYEDMFMNTIIANANEKNTIAQASKILQSGGLVAFPTETVYGLGGNALDADAAARIYAAKGRPSDNPLIVHIADTEAVYELASEVPDKARMLMEAYWPGPLTIILPKKDIVPDGTTGGLKTVAIRMPSHPAALQLIRESGVYIAAPSANTSGRPSPTKASHVIEDMTGKIDMIIDGGEVGIGIESTIVDLTSDVPAILRPGYITKTMIENIIGPVIIDPAIIHPTPDMRPKAPGMKYTHYAPKGELTVVECKASDSSGQKKVAEKINELVNEKLSSGFRVAVIATEETRELYKCPHILTVGSAGKGETVAARLYAVLRECDELSADYIYSEAFNYGELGNAIMNRLLKAAGQRVIDI
jgi:L-threonylcarbamoyladenylate synthase